MRKPVEFESHPASYADAAAAGKFRAMGRHVVDGDTYDVFVDLGLGKYAYEAIRLYDFDTAELRTGSPAERARGQAAKARTAELVQDKPLLLKTYRDAETFGRYVAETWYWDGAAWKSLRETLDAEGLRK